MTGSSRPRLRSEISRGHSHNDVNEGTSARTRPLSYDEIMRRRKIKKQKDVSREEAGKTEHAKNEESTEKLDHQSTDANAEDMKYSRDQAKEAGSGKKEDNSSRLVETPNLSKNKECHDSRSKQKYEKDLTSGREAVKTSRREHVSSNPDEVNQAMDSRSKHKHDKDVKNGSEVPKFGRGGHASSRTDGDIHDMDAESKNKHESNVKDRASLLKADTRGNVQHKMDDKIRDPDSRSKHGRTNYVKNDTQVLEADSMMNRDSLLKAERRRNVQHKMDDENRDMDSRSIPELTQIVKNVTRVSETDWRRDVQRKMDGGNRDMDSRSKPDYTKYVKNDTRVLETDSVKNRASLLKSERQGNVQHKMDDGNRDMDSRSKPEQTKYVKNDTRVLETDRVNNRASLLKTERRGNVQHRMDEGNRDVDSRSVPEHTKHVKNVTRVTDKRGNVQHKMDDRNRDMDSRSLREHTRYVKNDTRDFETDWQGHRSDRIDEESHDMNVGSKDKHEKYMKYSTPSSKIDRRENVRDRLDEESRDVESRSKSRHEKGPGYNAEGFKSKRQDHARSKQVEILRDADKYDNDDKRQRDSLAHSRYVEISRGASEMEKKRKNRSIDDERYRPRDSIIKYDSGHSLGSDISERKEKMEVSHLRHGESSTKRRRSRSQERSKDKDRTHRTSRSASPKARKNIVSREYDHDPTLSSHSKKDDSGRKLGSDISEKKEKTESYHLRHDESRTKRRRSRSQERSHDKGRRSRPASPQTQENMLSREHDHDPLSLHPQKERSRPNDADRDNVTSNGSNSYHRQHTGVSSGIGGYSPRKRKTDAAIKTPSPIRSPERKRAGRDLPSSGVDKSISSSVASNSLPVSQTMSSNKADLAIGTSFASSMGMPLSTTLFHGLSTFKDASIDSVQLTQATRPMRRLYIDNIPASASEKEIMESFNTHLLYSNSNHIRGTTPCISCMIHKEKGQALLEFLTPEDASAALSFDGRSLYGSMLKIRRPKDYVELTSGSAERLKSRVGRNTEVSDVVTKDVIKDAVISDIVKDSPHKIFVGGIGEGLSSEMIMEIFSVVGQLKAFHFNSNENLNEPCVFLEYADQSITSKACAVLNGMKCGGKILTVAQANPVKISKGNIETQPLYGIPEHVKPLLEKPTLVLKLSNVLDQKALESLTEMDLEEILEDVRLECLRFGSVVSINAVTTIELQTINSEVQEVINEEKFFEPHEETEPPNHHLNIDLPNVSPKHDERGVEDDKPLSYAEEINTLDSVEGDVLDLATSPAIEVEASRLNTSDMKEADLAANGPRQSIELVGSTVENTEAMNDYDVNHEEPIQGSRVPSVTEPSEDTGIEKLDDCETSHVDDVEQMDKATGKQQEVVSVSNDNSSSNLRTDICDIGNIFEVGCILVKFKRTEASCMAAHCLHGRLFDDRIVTVEYVPLEAYQARFPK